MNNQPNSKTLNEGLRPNDLVDLIYPIFEVDSFKSKMGEDKDVCVLTFQAKDRYPAKDMMEFVEKGYPFVLDADVSAGENKDGEYSIFIEIERSSRLAENISELIFGLSKLTGHDDWKFKYYKNDEKFEANRDNLNKMIPESGNSYERMLNQFKVNETKKFFNKTLMDDLTIESDVITFFKPFDNQYKFQIINNGDSNILETLDSPSIDESAMAEIFWLTKVFGNYDIQKIGENFSFTNGNKTYILKRID